MPAEVLHEPSAIARQLLHFEAASTPRKARLFACACARLAWDLLDAAAARRAVVTAEEYADGRVTAGEFRTASADARGVRKTASRYDAEDKRRYRALTAVYHASHSGQKGSTPFAHAVSALEALPTDLRDPSASGLVRCVFGVPTSLPPAPYSWLTPAVEGLAGEIYTARAWNRMPELADALTEAGCYWSPLLEHVRGGSAHARGCWALDFLLGRS